MDEVTIIDVILPCFQPPEGWYTNLCDEINFMNETQTTYDMRAIIVNDGSTDDISTGIEYVKEHLKEAVIIELSKNRGKGYAIKEGVVNSSATYALFTDIDLPYTSESILRICDNLVNGSADIVVGTRESGYFKGITWFRSSLSKFLRAINRFLLGLPIIDTQAGLKGFSNAAREVILSVESNRYLFDLELIKRAGKDHTLKLTTTDIQLRVGVTLSNMKLWTLLREIPDLFRIFLL